MDAVKNDVIKLVEKELKAANEKFPPFNSEHEGYAVLKEEIEEAEEYLNECKTWIESLWADIRQNENCMRNIYNLGSYATAGAIELIQVAAMAQKFMDMPRKE